MPFFLLRSLLSLARYFSPQFQLWIIYLYQILRCQLWNCYVRSQVEWLKKKYKKLLFLQVLNHSLLLNQNCSEINNRSAKNSTNYLHHQAMDFFLEFPHVSCYFCQIFPQPLLKQNGPFRFSWLKWFGEKLIWSKWLGS